MPLPQNGSKTLTPPPGSYGIYLINCLLQNLRIVGVLAFYQPFQDIKQTLTFQYLIFYCGESSRICQRIIH